MEKISIIVPVYNTENYLVECVESILNQSYENIELILINDGSADSSGKICDDYSKIDCRVKVMHKTNGGQSSARNCGLDLATGSYIGFVDSDDWIKIDMYEKLMTKAIETNSEVVACNISLMTRKGKFRNYSNSDKDYRFDKVSAMKEIFRNEHITFSPCNKLYKKELFNNLRFDKDIILEDKDISYKLIDKCDRVYYINEPLYCYRYNTESTLRGEFTLRRLDEYLVQKRMYEYYYKNYPLFSNLVYMNVFDVGLMLFSIIKAEKKYNLMQYSYLIDFKKDVLKKILREKDISYKNKVKIYFYLKIPKLLILILEIKYRFKKTFHKNRIVKL